MCRESVWYGGTNPKLGVWQVSVLPLNNCGWLISLMAFWYLHVCSCNFVTSDYELSHVTCFDKRTSSKVDTLCQEKSWQSAYVFHFSLSSLLLLLNQQTTITKSCLVQPKNMGDERHICERISEKTQLSQLSRSGPACRYVSKLSEEQQKCLLNLTLNTDMRPKEPPRQLVDSGGIVNDYYF